MAERHGKKIEFNDENEYFDFTIKVKSADEALLKNEKLTIKGSMLDISYNHQKGDVDFHLRLFSNSKHPNVRLKTNSKTKLLIAIRYCHTAV